tara:strand:+ start:1017 stop:1187 length:171 start_codon:yes stop_codon:yes gene_type:complete
VLTINKEDEVVKMILYTPHESDFIYRRPDNTVYVVETRKGKDKNIYNPEYQLSLQL